MVDFFLHLVLLQDIFDDSAIDNLYHALDNPPDTPYLPSNDNQPAGPLEQNELVSKGSALELCAENKDRCRYESVSSEGVGSDDGNTAISAEDLEIPTVTQTDIRPAGVPPLKHFYFYQGNDSCFLLLDLHCTLFMEVHLLLYKVKGKDFL